MRFIVVELVFIYLGKVPENLIFEFMGIEDNTLKVRLPDRKKIYAIRSSSYLEFMDRKPPGNEAEGKGY